MLTQLRKITMAAGILLIALGLTACATGGYYGGKPYYSSYYSYGYSYRRAYLPYYYYTPRYYYYPRYYYPRPHYRKHRRH